MSWKNLWLSLFNTTQWFGIDIGFWVSLLVISIIVIIMNFIFWTIKPKNQDHGMNV